MGGERFDTPQPEAYLFGENADLNFLGSRPTAVNNSTASYFEQPFLQIMFSEILVSVSASAGKRADQDTKESG